VWQRVDLRRHRPGNERKGLSMLVNTAPVLIRALVVSSALAVVDEVLLKHNGVIVEQ